MDRKQVKSPAHYPYLLDPKLHIDYTRRKMAVPTWKTFKNTTQFATLRCFSQKDGKLINWREDLDIYTKRFKLGKIIWPVFRTVFNKNFKEFAREIKKRKLYLFDIWGHVPGSGLEGMWSHVMPPEGMVDYLKKVLGERFLGFDNGEQDGRYVGGYSEQQCPSYNSRFKQYLNFQRHFERLCGDLGNHMSTLVSLSFGHYFLKEGNHLLIGAETAQALPSSQVYYSFIRGAGKQYGIHWFGNASVCNRWGMKTYEGSGGTEKWKVGPEAGTSLNLLKRLLYTHYMYNCVAVGFESGWINEDDVEKRLLNQPIKMELDRTKITLSPIGKIQSAAVRFVEKNGQPGVMHAPVALLLDHFSGWAVPRHMYTGNVYKVWGTLPYNAGDYLTHGVLSIVYPGYEDASYFRDERGFLSSTPYGDMADCLLSDAPLEVLKQYGLLIITSELSVDAELRDKIKSFVNKGGQIAVTAGNAREIWPEWKIGGPVPFKPKSKIKLADGRQVTEKNYFELYSANLPKSAKITAHCEGVPALAEIPCGAGRIILMMSPFGLNSSSLVSGKIRNDDETPLDCPFSLLEHVRLAVGEALAAEQVFSVGEGLGFITCRKRRGEYVLAIYNNSLSSRKFSIESRCGKVIKVKELLLDRSERYLTGYWPEGMDNNKPGISDDKNIAGGDIRLFNVHIEERCIRLLDGLSKVPRPRGRLLALHSVSDLKETILQWPSFFQHFDGVKIDWTYLKTRDRKQLEFDRDWLNRQGLRIVVDFSSGLNFYPGLTLVDTLEFRYKESLSAINDILDKMEILGAKDAVISLHRGPENHCDAERGEKSFLSGVRDLCKRAVKKNITLYLHPHPNKWKETAAETLEFIKKTGARNLLLCINTGHAAMNNDLISQIVSRPGNKAGMVLLSAPSADIFGQINDSHAPVNSSRLDLRFLRKLSNIPQVLDGDYKGWNEIYGDIRAVWK